MSDVTVIRGVPADRVGREVQQLVDSGAAKIECEKEPAGTWTIRAS